MLILPEGSLGPGIIHAKITFSILKRSARGRFSTTKYIAPTSMENPHMG